MVYRRHKHWCRCDISLIVIERCYLLLSVLTHRQVDTIDILLHCPCFQIDGTCPCMVCLSLLLCQRRPHQLDFKAPSGTLRTGIVDTGVLEDAFRCLLFFCPCVWCILLVFFFLLATVVMLWLLLYLICPHPQHSSSWLCW